MSGEWCARAACLGRPTEFWYPEGHSGCKARSDRKWDLPRRVCESCPVMDECREAALREEAGGGSRFGMRGGLTPDERARLARRVA